MRDNWNFDKIENIFQVSSGVGLIEAHFKPGSYRVYGGNGLVGFHDSFTSEKTELIIGRVGAHCGNVNLTQRQSWITDNALIVKLIIPNPNYKFWYYKLRSLNLRDFAFQSAQPVITGGILKNIEIKYPTPKKQKKIAKILSTCDAVIEKTEAAIAKYQDIKQGMMHDLFTRGIDLTTGKLRPTPEQAPELYKDSELGKIPKDWGTSTIDDIAFLRHGYQFRDFDFIDDEGIEIVKIGQVGKNGRLNLEKASKISFDRFDQFKQIHLFNEDVLMALTGATLGKTAMVKGISQPLLQNYRVGHFSPKDDKELNNLFLYYLLSGNHVQNEILGFVNEGAQGNIGKADFEKIKISYPHNISEQEAISKKLFILDDKIDSEIAFRNKHMKIKSGLMQDLLTGKVEVKVEQGETV